MRALWLVSITIGCSRPAPVPEREPVPPAVRVADAVQPIDAEVVDAEAVDALPDAPAAASPVVVEAEGSGTCKRDEDCELSSYQAGCSCTGSCSSYAISKVELARRIKKDNCPKVRTTPCPPPAPCPRPMQRSLDAFCKAGRCWAHRQVLTP